MRTSRLGTSSSRLGNMWLGLMDLAVGLWPTCLVGSAAQTTSMAIVSAVTTDVDASPVVTTSMSVAIASTTDETAAASALTSFDLSVEACNE